VLRISDRHVVLRHGKVVGEADPKTATQEILASMMVGREVVLSVEKTEAEAEEAVMTVRNLYVRDDRQLMAVNDLSLTVRSGEILGIAGVQGNGQTELVEAITGLRPVVAGHIAINGHDVTHFSPRRVTETGVAHVPENRHRHGMVTNFPITDNMRLQTYYKSPFSIGILANDRAINQHAAELVERYDVRTPSIFASISALSGGNQQKAVVAREFSRNSRLLIAAQPTRGLDVGSIEFIHRQIVNMRDNGSAVLLVSTELDEILSLSDRVAVMYAGEVIDVMPIEQADRETVGLLMAGVKPEQTETADSDTEMDAEVVAHD
jgi:simple sugar transport system ATP-binding protein